MLHRAAACALRAFVDGSINTSAWWRRTQQQQPDPQWHDQQLTVRPILVLIIREVQSRVAKWSPLLGVLLAQDFMSIPTTTPGSTTITTCSGYGITCYHIQNCNASSFQIHQQRIRIITRSDRRINAPACFRGHAWIVNSKTHTVIQDRTVLQEGSQLKFMPRYFLRHCVSNVEESPALVSCPALPLSAYVNIPIGGSWDRRVLITVSPIQKPCRFLPSETWKWELPVWMLPRAIVQALGASEKLTVHIMWQQEETTLR
jgi:hypothetical protein